MTDPDGGAPPTGRLATPRAAALAGILFAVLLGVAYILIRVSIPADPADDKDWLAENSGTVALALGIVPFAGLAFLWFMGVVRDRIGASEDRFVATVLLGSGLLFLAMLFVSAAIGAGLLATYSRQPEQMIESGLYSFGRDVMYRVSNTYAIRMAAVFMVSSGTIWVRTRTMPRWLALLTYGAAAVLLFTLGYSLWVSLVFPAWVLVVSLYILLTRPQGWEEHDRTRPHDRV
jgi:hypothetical protein